MDAGYVDNYGVSHRIRTGSMRTREWLAAKTSGVIMIQIRALSRRSRRPYRGRRERLYNGFGPLLTPLDVYTAANRSGHDGTRRTANPPGRAAGSVSAPKQAPLPVGRGSECPRVAALKAGS